MVDARRLWQRFEPYHAVGYFDPEVGDVFRRAGWSGFWMGYFATRAAPLGPVPPSLVTALFFGFAPRVVERALPEAWRRCGPERAWAVRLELVDRALRRHARRRGRRRRCEGGGRAGPRGGGGRAPAGPSPGGGDGRHARAGRAPPRALARNDRAAGAPGRRPRRRPRGRRRGAVRGPRPLGPGRARPGGGAPAAPGLDGRRVGRRRPRPSGTAPRTCGPRSRPPRTPPPRRRGRRSARPGASAWPSCSTPSSSCITSARRDALPEPDRGPERAFGHRSRPAYQVPAGATGGAFQRPRSRRVSRTRRTPRVSVAMARAASWTSGTTTPERVATPSETSTRSPRHRVRAGVVGQAGPQAGLGDDVRPLLALEPGHGAGGEPGPVEQLGAVAPRPQAMAVRLTGRRGSRRRSGPRRGMAAMLPRPGLRTLTPAPRGPPERGRYPRRGMAATLHPHLGGAPPAGWVRVDLHAHTMWSGDATTTPDELEAAVEAAGIDVLCITDHGTVNGATALAGTAALPGGRGRGAAHRGRARSSACSSPSACPAGLSPRGGGRAHPGPGRPRLRPPPVRPDPALPAGGRARRPRRRRPGRRHRGAATPRRPLSSLNDRAAAFAAEHGFPAAPGSDAHVPEAIGAAYVEMPDFDGPGFVPRRAGRRPGWWATTSTAPDLAPPHRPRAPDRARSPDRVPDPRPHPRHHPGPRRVPARSPRAATCASCPGCSAGTTSPATTSSSWPSTCPPPRHAGRARWPTSGRTSCGSPGAACSCCAPGGAPVGRRRRDGRCTRARGARDPVLDMTPADDGRLAWLLLLSAIPAATLGAALEGIFNDARRDGVADRGLPDRVRPRPAVGRPPRRRPRRRPLPRARRPDPGCGPGAGPRPRRVPLGRHHHRRRAGGASPATPPPGCRSS